MLSHVFQRVLEKLGEVGLSVVIKGMKILLGKLGDGVGSVVHRRTSLLRELRLRRGVAAIFRTGDIGERHRCVQNRQCKRNQQCTHCTRYLKRDTTTLAIARIFNLLDERDFEEMTTELEIINSTKHNKC